MTPNPVASHSEAADRLYRGLLSWMDVEMPFGLPVLCDVAHREFGPQGSELRKFPKRLKVAQTGKRSEVSGASELRH
ncbi:hypothetical protein VTK26DRAFT_3786 [Humicola hyalothermophila]